MREDEGGGGFLIPALLIEVSSLFSCFLLSLIFLGFTTERLFPIIDQMDSCRCGSISGADKSGSMAEFRRVMEYPCTPLFII